MKVPRGFESHPLRTRVSDAEKIALCVAKGPHARRFLNRKSVRERLVSDDRRGFRPIISFSAFRRGLRAPAPIRQGGLWGRRIAGELDQNFRTWRVGTAGETSDLLELVRRATKDIRDHDRSKLENWIVKSFSDTYNREGAHHLEWVRRCDQSDCAGEDKPPDYMLAAQPDSVRQLVEVTEVLDPGRKRQQEYRETLEKIERCGTDFAARDLPETPASYESDLIRRARVVLEDKFRMRYPRGTWLIVYFNPVLIASSGEDSHSFGVRVIEQALSQLARADRIEQVWMLSNRLKVARLL